MDSVYVVSIVTSPLLFLLWEAPVLIIVVVASLRFNRGRGRKMPPGMDRPLVHKSVKLRMEHVPKYKPKVREWASLNPIWVD